MIEYEINIRIEELNNIKQYLDHEIINARIEFLETLKNNRNSAKFQYPQEGWVD